MSVQSPTTGVMWPRHGHVAIMSFQAEVAGVSQT